MKIWTHRGNPSPENTLEAFSKAWDDGIRFFETDIHCTKDGVLVLAHDPDIARLTAKQSTISELTYEELIQFKIHGRWSWATLDQIYEEFPEATISIDIKSDHALDPFIAWAEGKDLSNLVVGSFSSRRTIAFRQAHPGSRTALTSTEIMAINLGLRWILRSTPESVVAMVPIQFKGIPVLTKRFRNFCASREIEINVWTVNNPSDVEKLKSLGVVGVVTDNYSAFIK
jgi:glycerophosphoryl diester phosphodiesterase